MRITILIIMTLSLTGCGAYDRLKARIFGDGTKVCVEGVSYLQFTSGVTVQYNTDGSIRTCSY